jgi:hypothetical protein
VTSYENAALAIQHFSYAAILASLFAAVTVAYLVAMWRLAVEPGSGRNWLLHTLYGLWQSNIAFVAVVSLSIAVEQAEAAGAAMQGWSRAPLLVPSAAVLYTSVLVLSVLAIWLRGRHSTTEDSRV